MRTMKNMALAAAAASALALAGCGGGGSGGSASAPRSMDVAVSFTVPAAFQPGAGTYEIAAGGNAVVNGVQYNCAGPGACTVIVDANGMASSLGGNVTATKSPSLAAYDAAQAAAEAQVAAAEAAQAAAEARATSAEADKAAAEAAQAAAEARATEAEAARAAAEAAQTTAEADAEAARTAQAAAEAAQATAEAAQAAAEAAQAAAEAAQATAEADAEAARTAQATAEAEAAAARAAQAAAEENTAEARARAEAAEAARVDAVAAQAAAEAEAAAALEAQMAAEQEQAAAEAAKVAAEEAQMRAEELQAAAETARMAAEEAQMAAEEAQMAAEEDKAAAEERARQAEEARMAAEEAKRNAEQALADAEEEQRQAEEEQRQAMVRADARKLYLGVAAQSDAVTATVSAGTPLSDGQRGAAYNDADQPAAGTDADTRIMVGIGTAAIVALSEDKKTMVPAHHGWEGKRYTAEPTGDGMYEAVVYSNVGEPTQGKKFGNAEVGTQYEYTLASGMLALITSGSAETAFSATRVGGPSFDHSAGVKQFKLPSPNTGGATNVSIAGTYHGVSGTYVCTPGTGNACGVRVAASGFDLGTVAADNTFTDNGGTWTFRPSSPEARVTSMPDAIYASYGWWIHKSADGNTFTASAFVDDKGEVPNAAGLTALQGTATYMGGAAGKYALQSSTGGTNDAGHFTADATLEADFSDNSITGTIDNFMGADGMSRDWSVELKEAAVADTGAITRTGADQTDNDTVWTIGEDASDASGSWGGSLQDNGDDGVPKVGTGTFNTEFGVGGTSGKMVGAFGVNKQ